MKSSDDEMTMTPKRPYLVRAFYEWILDNGLTPHVLVDASVDKVVVPRQYVKNGSIVLNLNPSAIQNLFMDNDAVSFQARFSGSSFSVYLPMPALKAVYARENQQGAYFHDSEYAAANNTPKDEKTQETLSSVENTQSTASDSDDVSCDEKPKPTRTRPTLRVVK